ncbi:MAG: 1-acyl-sn-glycerol-3-phosphate acyltransferase [Firmicutes bacterium]|nr:1-acyl-sn-glycerol-3-phosphate acyltransferase [[Eubacterium] siraeum]MCM1488723.1 1-acyl-sn-glycerol-3-phosphate acyltransferase [Bacillota bacterium]
MSAYGFARKCVEIFFLHIKYKAAVLNPENIPDLSGGFIVACNHQSYSDPPVLAGVFKGKFSFMAKSELFKNKLFAWIITKCGAFPVVRGAKDTGALDRAVEDLKKNRIFVIFPEGTRSKDGVIARAKSGVAMIAGMADAPVVPVCIMYGVDGKKRHIAVAVGEMIPKEEIVLEDMTDRKQIKQVSSRIMDDITQLQRQICGEYHIPVPGSEALL